MYVRGITNNVDEKVLLQNLEGAVDARIMREGAKDLYVDFVLAIIAKGLVLLVTNFFPLQV